MYETQAGKGCMQSLKLYSFWTKLSLRMGIPRDDIEIATIASWWSDDRIAISILQVWQLSVSRAMTAKKSAR